MTYKPIRTGIISDGTVKRSYQLLSLLTVCEHCAFHTDDEAGAQDLSTVLRSLKTTAAMKAPAAAYARALVTAQGSP